MQEENVFLDVHAFDFDDDDEEEEKKKIVVVVVVVPLKVRDGERVEDIFDRPVVFFLSKDDDDIYMRTTPRKIASGFVRCSLAVTKIPMMMIF